MEMIGKVQYCSFLFVKKVKNKLLNDVIGLTTKLLRKQSPIYNAILNMDLK